MKAALLESDRVRGEFVAALFTAAVPLIIMTATSLFVGSYNGDLPRLDGVQS